MAEIDLEDAFEHWQAMAALQIDFLEALGEHKLQAAKAELARAVAAQHWAVARMKATVANELESSLKRLTRQRNQVNRFIQRLGRHAKSAAKIRSGEDLRPSQLALMWAGYTVFERLTPVSVLDELSLTALHPTVRDGCSYADPRQPEVTCPSVPQEIDNVLALIGWLKHEQLVPRRGTHAYRQVIGAFSRIAGCAATEIEKTRAALQGLEQNTYENWKPLIIAALPDSVDVKKIIGLSAK
jgi:hypothetical protein